MGSRAGVRVGMGVEVVVKGGGQWYRIRRYMAARYLDGCDHIGGAGGGAAHLVGVRVKGLMSVLGSGPGLGLGPRLGLGDGLGKGLGLGLGLGQKLGLGLVAVVEVGAGVGAGGRCAGTISGLEGRHGSRLAVVGVT